MGLKQLLHIGKRSAFHPFREYRRMYFRFYHSKLEPHDIVCQTKDFSLKLCSDSVLAEPLFVGAGFEESEAALLRHLARLGMKVIDVGANIGLYTVLLGNLVGKTGHVWSFEPFPPVVNYLKKNIELNKLTNITVIEMAVAEKEGVLDFHVFPEGCDVYNSLGAANRPTEQLQAVQKIPVRVTTLDTIAYEVGITEIDLLKIDVEGAEERVLKGAEKIIRRNPNIKIIMEIYEPSAKQCGCSSDRMIEMLLEWGFSIFKIGPGGIQVRCSADDFSGVYALFKRD
ncbi:FkbM family methyltransferase [Thermodesulfobacteriota bacterium]